MARTGFLALALAVTLAGCGKQAVECSGDSAANPVISIVKRELENETANRLRASGGVIADRSKIRAAIAQVAIVLEDVRTSKEDPNSTKRFCVATLKLKFSSQMLDDANSAREAANLNSVSELAELGGVDHEADTLSAEVEFNVQPTDDGSKVFAEMESGDSVLEIGSEVLASGLQRGLVEQQQRERDAAELSAEVSQNEALDEQRMANLNLALSENKLAVQTIKAAWDAIPKVTKARILPLQRAWIRKKTADCNIEAAAASTLPEEVAIAQLMCDTRMSNERLPWLQQNREQEETISLPPVEEAAFVD